MKSCIRVGFLFNTHVSLMQMEPTTEFTVKLRGVPFTVKEVTEHRFSHFKDAAVNVLL